MEGAARCGALEMGKRKSDASEIGKVRRSAGDGAWRSGVASSPERKRAEEAASEMGQG